MSGRIVPRNSTVCLTQSPGVGRERLNLLPVSPQNGLIGDLRPVGVPRPRTYVVKFLGVLCRSGPPGVGTGPVTVPHVRAVSVRSCRVGIIIFYVSLVQPDEVLQRHYRPLLGQLFSAKTEGAHRISFNEPL